MCLSDEQDRGRDVMLKHTVIAALLTVGAFPQTRAPVAPFEQLDEIRVVTCKGQVPEKFHCAILFDLDFAERSLSKALDRLETLQRRRKGEAPRRRLNLKAS